MKSYKNVLYIDVFLIPWALLHKGNNLWSFAGNRIGVDSPGQGICIFMSNLWSMDFKRGPSNWEFFFQITQDESAKKMYRSLCFSFRFLSDTVSMNNKAIWIVEINWILELYTVSRNISSLQRNGIRGYAQVWCAVQTWICILPSMYLVTIPKKLINNLCLCDLRSETGFISSVNIS